ncbi:hypothetical protein G6L30_17100 [Agrobacterium rhizogenes]|nr:hypothetical protein [Rhizobium rhizogenes]
MEKLEELIAALEKATGPDRWCDANIYAMAHGQTIQIFGGNIVSNGHSVIGWLDPGKVNVNFTPSGIGELIPRYTASIDAAVALVERVLPGWRIENLSEWDAEILRDQGPWMCDLVQRRLEFFDRKSAKCSHAPTAALALCIATLRALFPKEQP